MNQHLQSFATSRYFICLCFVASSSLTEAVKTLYIGGLFPLTGSSVASAGKDMLPACELAMNMVNNHSDILTGYRLQMIWNDTKCNPGHATNALFESLYTRPPMIMLLGAACSSATRATAQAGALWNLLQVSYASTSSDLSDKKQFPLLYSIVPPDSSTNNARIAFLKHFNWKRIATIQQNDYVFNGVMNAFQESLIQHDFEVIASELFTDDPKTHIETLKKRDARIIVAMFYEDQARKVFCEAYKQGMFGERYMWLLLDWYDNKQWWRSADDEVDCTEEQMSQATEGYFSVESVRIVSNNKPTISGITSEEFLNTHIKPRENNTDVYVPFVFDSVWMIALTLNNSIQLINTKLNKSLEDFTYKDNNMAELLKQTLEELEFQGITGRIQFTDTGERTRPACLKQMQSGYSVTVGTYFLGKDKIVFDGADVNWQGGSPPSDGRVTIYEIQYVSTPLFCVIVILTSGGILLALYFLWFNFVQREHSYIKLSSPNLNNLIVLGCVLVYMSVYMVAIDGKRVDTSILPGLCVAKGFLLSIGYSLAVGAMFSKTWRVYQIFNNVKPKKKIFKDKELAGVIVLLVTIDVVVMSLWAGVDPPELITATIHSQVKDEPNQTIIPQQQYCTSKHMTTWLYILLGYKILLLVIGCFIAWVTRKVKVRSLNDSRFVGMSVYNIVLFAVVGIPLSFLIDGHINVFVACLSLFILLPTTVSLCLLFVPKIIKLKNNTEELLRLQSLSAIRDTTDSNPGSLESNNNDPNVIIRLQGEIALLKREIRTLKLINEDTTPNKASRISDVMENGGSARTVGKLTPRPQLGKRSITCINAQEMRAGPRRRKRSCSFSGPYLQRRSFDLGSLSSALADPLLVLRAENKELKRRVQAARISETGKLAKVLYENAELNKKIVELNMQNTPTEDAEKVSRLMKENAELKKQLGEVSILNSVWCETTPKLQRKQADDRKMTKELKELQQLLKVDLGGRRHGSFGSTSLSRPPPIGRSQSSVDLQIRKEGGSWRDKKSNISPLASDVLKRFSYDEVVSKKGSSSQEDSQPRITLTVTEADKAKALDSPQPSPSAIRRDNIDGCESNDQLKDNYNVGERINEGFREDEETQPSRTQMKTTEKVPKETPRIRAPESFFESEDQLKDNYNNGEKINEGFKEDEETQPSSTQMKTMRDSAKSGPNNTSAAHVPDKATETKSQPTHDHLPPIIQDVVFPNSENILFQATESIHDAIQAPLTSFDVLLDKNYNLQSTKIVRSDSSVQESNNLKDNVKNDDFLNQDMVNHQGENKLLEITPEVVIHEELRVGGSIVASDLGSAEDCPSYKRKLKRKRDTKKNEKIEKTYFV